MSTFVRRFNFITGKKEWCFVNNNYDYKQEIARSSYADMLHDTDRNLKYLKGIENSIAILKSQKREIHVLDIGTGTGLLSMMALKCGADSVTACEAFRPMSECAEEIFKINGFSSKVNLIHKRSTEIECGPGKDMEKRANLLVTEVFDTELIGEGALGTYIHAKENLLTEDALLVPCAATMHAKVISSDLVRKWNKLESIRLSGSNSNNSLEISVPNSINSCPGLVSVHDIQLSELKPSSFKPLSEELSIFSFDWSGRERALRVSGSSAVNFEAVSGGAAVAVLVWWRLQMDATGDVVLSCVPSWLPQSTDLEEKDDVAWRDHWLQGVYFLPQEKMVEKGEALSLFSQHDEYNLWFNLGPPGGDKMSQPVCRCGFHATVSRPRIGQLNDVARRERFLELIQRQVSGPDVSGPATALFLGDHCLWALAAAELGAQHVYVRPSEECSSRVLRDFISANDVGDKITILDKPLAELSEADLVKPITFVFSEPYFESSLLPWHSIQFSFRLRELPSSLLAPGAAVYPGSVTVYAVPVQFQDLWKIRSPLGSCCGFKMDPFDKLIEDARNEVDESVEPQPLWEYPGVALGEPCPVATLSTFPLSEANIESSARAEATSSGVLNGVALWAEWQFGQQFKISSGPVSTVRVGQQITWDMYSRQGVYLFPKTFHVSTDNPTVISIRSTFNITTGVFNFNFEAEKKT